MRCCRYMKFEHAAESLRDCFFKVSGPLEFNDPFECRGRYVNFDGVLHQYIHDNFERLRFEAILRTRSTTPEQQDRFTEQYFFKLYFDAATKTFDGSWAKTVNDTVRMLCLVKEQGLTSKSDVLFWSHYADAGKGVRIIFDLKSKPKGGVYYMKDVEYLDKIPVFDCRKMEYWMQGDEFKNYLERLAHVKGKAWEYENEIRMIIPRRIPEQMKRVPFAHLCPREKDGVTHYFVRINYDAIRRIDFGPHVDLKQAARLIEDLKHEKGTGHIAFWQATLGSGSYTYIYQKVA